MNAGISVSQQVHGTLETTPLGVTARFEGYTLCSAFQPIVTLDSLKVIGQEGLIRGRCAQGNAIDPPALFAREREMAQLIHLDRLCRALHIVNFVGRQPPDSLIFLNVHPLVSIHGRHYGSFFDEFTQQVGLPMQQVVIEILEDPVLDDRQLADSVNFYRERGCKVAIDDFGVGHSNFRRIVQVKPDIVKLDRSLLGFARNYDITGCVLGDLISALHDAGCTVVAEGVEDQYDAMLAAKSGADWGQGYHFGRPQQASSSPLRAEARHALQPAAAPTQGNARGLVLPVSQL